jgi:hypothetical protein
MKAKLLILISIVCFGNQVFGQLFGLDEIIDNNPSVGQSGEVKITSAFNGWLFSIFALDNGGLSLLKSTDKGATWVDFNSASTPSNITWNSYDLEVSGNTLSNLLVTTAEVTYNSSNSMYELNIFTFNSDGSVNTITPIASSTSNIYDVDLSKTGNKLGCIYSKTAALDSIIFIESIDAGANWSVPSVIATTSLYFRNVSLSYGRSLSNTSPIAFAAWDQFSASSGNEGVIYTSKAEIGMPWDAPINMDGQLTNPNRCSNPKIATMNTTASTSAGGSLSSVIAFEYDYNGDSTDIDILGFVNDNARNDQTWINIDFAATGQSEVSPDIIYGINDYALSYFNKTLDQIEVFGHDYDVNTAPLEWLTLGYANDGVTGTDAKPNLSFNLYESSFDIAWTKTTAINAVAMYDAFYDRSDAALENSSTSDISIKLFPNPTHDKFTVEFLSKSEGDYTIQLIDMSGKVILEEQTEGGNTIRQIELNIEGIAIGMYTVKLSNSKEVFTTKLSIR